MPATEATWRNQYRLNVVFAVTSLILFGATIWMFYQDHKRSWKKIQPIALKADQRMNRWRQEQIQSEQFEAMRGELGKALLEARSAPIPDAPLAGFLELAQNSPRQDVSPGTIDSIRSQANRVAELREDDPTRAAQTRDRVVKQMRNIVAEAKTQEDIKAQSRKFTMAELDAARAGVDLGVRDHIAADEMTKRHAKVADLMGRVDRLTDETQSLVAYRKGLENHLKTITADVDAAAKAIDDHDAGVKRLETAYVEKRETYVSWTSLVGIPIPLPGKQWLNFPIIDAFGTPRKIENNWSEGLEQNYNFRNVRRFDRCVTCHQMIGKSAPGQPTTPAYIPERTVEFLLTVPSKEVVAEVESLKLSEQLEKLFGIKLADFGLVDDDAVTVRGVVPESTGSRALPVTTAAGEQTVNVGTLRDEIAQLCEIKRKIPDTEVAPGLLVGDVISAVEGVESYSPARVATTLVDLARERANSANPEPIRLRIRRGLPGVYTSHPRLDLFVSDSSPHSMGTFACTICHEGQGSATDFKWASHTPNDPIEAERWHQEHGWFDNPHWIYPMNPQRFAESSCLKCHHDVVELEPSERFPEAPAAKLTHGYHLIRKYGCYGCHEVNGFDGPNRRVGPDLRLEPNYFAVAQDLLAKAKGEGKAQEAVSMARELVAHPEDNATRNRLRQLIDEDAGGESPELGEDIHRLASMLKDVETPGSLRKPGPSLRYFSAKLDFEKSSEDGEFVYDWIKQPKNFRSSTRMPQFFKLWDHLSDAEGHMHDHVAPKFEPLEIRGIMAYLAKYDQVFEPLKPSEVDLEADIERGKQQFETRGCLACHTHADFPDTNKYRKGTEIVQGPDLSGLGSKFRSDTGKQWLYSWIKEPTRYHARTVMPNLFLDPITDGEGKTSDPVADITAYLLGSKNEDWKPEVEGSPKFDELEGDAAEALNDIVYQNLIDAAFKTVAQTYTEYGIPEDMKAEFRGAEQELFVSRDAYSQKQPLSARQKLEYLGRKTISKYGCYGCHDIPGFEDAKPIGTGLADWGRKDPAKLAFEHIGHFMEVEELRKKASDEAKRARGETVETPTAEERSREGFFEESLAHGHRAGFLNQKLRQPRSYDYEKTEFKRYNERLRMPQFPFSAEDRESIATFVLGLVAEPPREKYVYQPSPRQAAIQQGKVVLEKYNCGGCHILQLEKWQLSYAPGEIPKRGGGKPDFPFLMAHVGAKELAAHSKTDHRGFLHSTIQGMPALGKPDARPILREEIDGQVEQLEDDGETKPNNVIQSFWLFEPAIIDGNVYGGGETVPILGRLVDAKYPMVGGDLTRYLATRVLELEREANPNASGSEVYGWLPPPLVWEGKKVQTAWLHDFLLNPYPIRPAAFLRMPRFNMSSEEASALVNYFAAVDNASYPYEFATRRQSEEIVAKENEYRERIGEPALPADADHAARFDAAMQIVTDGNYCVKCHLVGDFAPPGNPRAKAPNLADIYRRMRPEYLRDWIANPARILPYTSMPVNVEYDPEKEHKGGVKQELFEGTSVEQLNGLVDLLMNYDQYSRSKFSVKPLIKAPAPMENAAGEAPAGESN